MRKDREPLRIPDNWRGQDRQFVIQLERVLDYMSWSIIPETYDWDAITNKPANYPGGCTGNAATATVASSVAWDNVSSKPANYPGGCTGTAGGVAWDNVSSKPANYPGGCTGNAATATTASSVAWDNVSSKPSAFPPSSHTHDISQVTWAAGSNLVCNGANTEWSVDMQASATGSYWHVWSGKNGKSVLCCYNDNCNVSIPNGTLSTVAITTTGTITRGSVSGIAYIDGPSGVSALHVNKGEGAIWYPIISTRTAGGGGWAIGNYNSETLQFVYGTKANINAHNNSTTIVDLPVKAGTLCFTDQAISNITRSGTTFTATRANGTTFTFTQQDNNTTYSASTGLGLSGTAFYLANSLNLSTSGSGLTATYSKIGNMLTIVQIQGNFSAAYSGNTNILTIPSGYRPTGSRYYPCYVNGACDRMAIYTDGTVKIPNSYAKSAYVTCIAVYT